MTVVPAHRERAAVPTHRASRRYRSILVAVAIAFVGAASGCTGTIGSSVSDSSDSSTSVSDLDPDRVAETASLTASDLPAESNQTGDNEPLTRSDDACKIISSSRYLAGVSSASFDYTDAGVAKTFYSIVAVEPSAAAAKKIASTFASPGWTKRCDAPRHVAADLGFIVAKNATSDCDLSLADHSESAIPTEALPAGVTGWTYDATWHCGKLDVDVALSYEKYLTHVGPVVIEVLAGGQSGTYPSGKAPQVTWTSDERRVIAQLENRVRGLGHT